MDPDLRQEDETFRRSELVSESISEGREWCDEWYGSWPTSGNEHFAS
ncbi:hypothetical protein J8L98_23895 [Pseudoalteromonas sp. MMG013]|nr:hypothetical protein [Pseudoalteromonas sp. MMG013]MBQ4864731.1 hypothetical protein [Pseudoalteromonas sp. MMG013]